MTPATTPSIPPSSAAASSCASQGEVTAVALDTGELAASHRRSFARHRTITALEHARALKARRGSRREPAVELRPLAAYDAVIA